MSLVHLRPACLLVRKTMLGFELSRQWTWSLQKTASMALGSNRSVSLFIIHPRAVQRSYLQHIRRPTRNALWPYSIRLFQTVSDYHLAADEMLESIQDAVDEVLEEKGIPDFEVTLASGVLTLIFPPHGTWVINKQTPNQQLWWSSPISGPRRYEYEDGEWVFTRDESHSMTLAQALQDEVGKLYGVELGL